MKLERLIDALVMGVLFLGVVGTLGCGAMWLFFRIGLVLFGP